MESLQINGTSEALKVAGSIHGVRDKHLIRKLHGVNGTLEDMNSLMTIDKAYRALNLPPPRIKEVYAIHPGEVSSVARRKEEKFEGYPILTKTPSEIWRTEGLKWEQPRPLRDNPARDKSRYYEYHKVHGHDTNDCWHLKKQIEKYHADGDLKHLVGQKKGEKTPKEGKKKDGEVVHEIYTISGKAEDSKFNSKRRTRNLEVWMCTLLTVPACDGCYNTNSLNITAFIRRYKMHRVFVDTGSSSDILYEHAFKKMSWEDQQLMEKVDYPVMGFSGEMVKISLPLTIGEGRKQCTINITKVSNGVSALFKKVEKIFSGVSSRGVFDLVYKPRTTIKAEAITDFIADAPEGFRGAVEGWRRRKRRKYVKYILTELLVPMAWE
ncbi:hypothetical protein E3N88_38321 [Mikania micrantha]|uniref:Peptidase A2 domain-containing protein n=1 Tax=Mikania micrantha TaxID=192012 RepID=A0A5N6LTN8_9ASTR|nr:hypothetical protein E3N88_38321 [Mikania micrantha]